MNAHLAQVVDGKIQHAFPVSADGTVVGRDAGCLVQIPDPRVSKRHAWIKHDGTQWYIEDRGSRNGTTVNGAPVTRTPLKHHDEVVFGVAKYTFIEGSIEDSGFAPYHVIDLSDDASVQTLAGPATEISTSVTETHNG